MPSKYSPTNGPDAPSESDSLFTDASRYLLNLADHIVAPYAKLSTARAGMVTGSSAKGVADYFSDLDMTVYYADALPDDGALQSIRHSFGARERKWTIGDRKSGSFAAAYDVDGIEVQIGHTTIEAWQAAIDKVLVEHDCESSLQKAMEGTLVCRALFGGGLIDQWQQRIRAYPEELGVAMVNHHLRFFPLWGLEEHFRTRDATIWYYEMLVEACHHLVGVLAGLNQLFFTSFQFKRAQRFIGQMRIKPVGMAHRLERLFEADIDYVLPALEGLVDDTLGLVGAHMPNIDTTRPRSRIGWRHQAWQPAE